MSRSQALTAHRSAAGCDPANAMYFVSDHNENQVRVFHALTGESRAPLPLMHSKAQAAQRLGAQAHTSVPLSRLITRLVLAVAPAAVSWADRRIDCFCVVACLPQVLCSADLPAFNYTTAISGPNGVIIYKDVLYVVSQNSDTP